MSDETERAGPPGAEAPLMPYSVRALLADPEAVSAGLRRDFPVALR